MYIPGKNLTNFVRSAIADQPVDRRVVLFGLGESVVVSSISPLAYAQTAEPLDFDGTVRTVSERYSLGPTKKLGPNMVFYLEDIHIPSVMKINRQKIDFLESEFDISLVGLEGRVQDPSGEIHRSVVERLDEIYKRNQNVFLFDGQRLLIYRPQDALPNPITFQRDEYEILETDNRFTTYGLEDKENILHVALIAEIEKIYDELSTAALQGPTIISVNDSPHLDIYRLQRSQEVVSQSYEDFPRFDLEKIPEQPYGNHKIRVLRNGEQQLGGNMIRFMEWMGPHMVDARTIDATNKLADKIKSEGHTRSAFIFGKGHSRPSLYERWMETSFQEELEKHDLSYITIRV